MERPENASEVVRILRQIEAEYRAAQYGLTGFAEGASHEAITARLENLGKLHTNLAAIVGDRATKLLVECLESIPAE